MNRRTASKGIAGLGYAPIIGVKYFIGYTNQDRGKLEIHTKLIEELIEVIIP